MINLLYFVVLLLIATAPLHTWEKPLKLISEIIVSNLHIPGQQFTCSGIIDI